VPSVCSKKHCCEKLYRDKILVFDSSSLFNILDAIVENIPSSLSEDRRFEAFNWSLGQLFSKIRLCCSGTVLNVTTQVFDEEIDPLNPKSTLRNHQPFIRICRNDEDNFRRIYRLFRAVFQPQRLDSFDQKIQMLTRLASSGPNQIYHNPSENDFSLLLLTLELSPKNETLLLTDDSNLHRASENVCAHRYVDLSLGSIDTQRLFATSSLSYMQELYGCCELNANDFWSLVGVLWNFIEKLKTSSNPSYEVHERELNQTIRIASGFNK
jgi:hypothetical protein